MLSGRRGDLVLLGVSITCAAVYLVKGANFTLDDWFFLRNAHFDGAWHAAGDTGGDRPLGGVVYVITFGLIGAHPGVIVLLLAVGNGLCAVLLRRILTGLGAGSVAHTVGVLWLALPLRTSLEIWMCTGSAVVASALTLTAVLLVVPRHVGPGRVATAAVLMAAGALSYESLCLLGVPVVMGLRIAHTRRLVWAELIPLTVAPGLAFAWAFTHRLDGRHAVGGLRNPIPVIDANFGRGIAPVTLLAAVTMIAALVGSVLVVRSTIGRPAGDRWSPTVALLTVGWAITGWGVVPYLTYFYSPYGAGDRLNVLSAFGAALVWAGLLSALPRRTGIGLTLALLAIGTVTRWDRAQLWSEAGLDGQRIAAAVVAAHPHPDRPILVGPEPIVVDNIAAFIDHSNIEAAIELAYDDRSIEVYLALSREEFEASDPAQFIRFDMRELSDLDERTGFVDG